MKKSNPLVSVIIPTFERPDSLQRTINSVLNSTYKEVEIIVVDDNNAGDICRRETEEIMNNYLESFKNIKYIKHKANKNGSAARNTGIRSSEGKYIMFLDDDDEFLEKKIEAQVLTLESKDNSWGACYTKYVDLRDGKIVSKSAENQEGNLLINELARNFFVHAGSNLMVRRNVVLEVNGFDESFIRNQDVEFLIRILKKYKIAFVDELGLIVHTRPRKYKITYYELTDHYVDKFRDTIESLEDSDKKVVFRMIGLQLVRNAIENYKIKDVIQFRKNYGLKWISILDYMLHLVYRKFSKKSYGYNLDKLYTR